jgi:hypothetical protein
MKNKDTTVTKINKMTKICPCCKTYFLDTCKVLELRKLLCSKVDSSILDNLCEECAKRNLEN